MEEPEDGIQLSGFSQIKSVNLFLGASILGAFPVVVVLVNW
tara:strand:+ start:992 stop:1114 length:123 start_codon:yes stop_codon:yes gene_type:complete